MVCDVSKKEEILKLISVINEHYPDLSILVNNAGMLKNYLVQFVKRASIEELIGVNTIGPILFTSKLLKKKKLLKHSSIVFTSSIGGPNIGNIAKK